LVTGGRVGTNNVGVGVVAGDVGVGVPVGSTVAVGGGVVDGV